MLIGDSILSLFLMLSSFEFCRRLRVLGNDFEFESEGSNLFSWSLH